MNRCVPFLAAFVLCTLSLHAWPQAKPSETFDTVSIRPASANANNVALRFDPNEFVMKGMPLRFFLIFALGIHDSQLVDLPAWAASAHYDIVGKMDDLDAGASSSEDLRQQVLRKRLVGMLKERFNFQYVSEVDERPVYGLVPSKSGIKLIQSEGLTTFSTGPGQIKAENLSVGKLAEILSDAADRMIVDKTSLTGTYTFSLRWSPREDAQLDSPGLFTAIQEQLGLKLVPQKAPIQVIRVQHIEVPTLN